MPLPSVPLSSIRQPAILFKADGRIAAANDLAEAFAGRSLAGLSAPDVVRLFFHRRFDGSLLLPGELPGTRALGGEEVIEFPLSITAASGRTLDILATASPVRDGDAVTGALVVWQDITRRNRAEAALRESEERFRLARECARIGVWEWTPPAGGGEWRDGSFRIFDDAQPPCLAMTELRALVHLEDREQAEAALDAALALGEPLDLEFRYSPAPGECRWLRALGDGVYDGGGRLLRVVGVHMDITEQKEAEAALRESERRQAFLLALGDRLRELGDLVEITAAACEMLGHHLAVNGVVYCEVDVTGAVATVRADWTDGTVPDAQGSYQMDDLGIGAFLRGGGVRRSSDVRAEPAGGGSGLHCALGVRGLVGAPIFRGGRLTGVIAAFTTQPRAWADTEVDLVREAGDRIWAATGRARAEEALRKKERTLEGIIRAAPVGIGMVSHRIITQVNDRFCRMTGYARDELLGRDARLLYPDDEAYDAVGQEKYAQIASHGIGAVETRWRRKDGAIRHILLSSTPVDLSRPFENVVFNALDLTALRESERALAACVDDLARSNEELQRFAYAASHDLQESLQSIVSASQLLERRYRGTIDTDADEYIAFIVEGGTRMQRLVQTLLASSGIETGHSSTLMEDAGEVADGVLLVVNPDPECGCDRGAPE